MPGSGGSRPITRHFFVPMDNLGRTALNDQPRREKKGGYGVPDALSSRYNYHFLLPEESATRGVASLNTYVQADTFLRRPAMR